MSRMPWERKNLMASASGNTVTPPGLLMGLASRASSLVRATPHDTGIFSCSARTARTWRATCSTSKLSFTPLPYEYCPSFHLVLPADPTSLEYPWTPSLQTSQGHSYTDAIRALFIPKTLSFHDAVHQIARFSATRAHLDMGYIRTS